MLPPTCWPWHIVKSINGEDLKCRRRENHSDTQQWNCRVQSEKQFMLSPYVVFFLQIVLLTNMQFSTSVNVTFAMYLTEQTSIFPLPRHRTLELCHMSQHFKQMRKVSLSEKFAFKLFGKKAIVNTWLEWLSWQKGQSLGHQTLVLVSLVSHRTWTAVEDLSLYATWVKTGVNTQPGQLLWVAHIAPDWFTVELVDIDTQVSCFLYIKYYYQLTLRPMKTEGYFCWTKALSSN